MSIKSTIELYHEMKNEGVSYLLTSRLNQDALESTFSTIRYMGGHNSHPTAVEFCDRLRMLLVSKDARFVVSNPAVEYNEENQQFVSSEIIGNIEEILPSDVPVK